MSPSLILYRLLLPVYVLISLPGWLLKMARRGGFGSGLAERASIYDRDLEFEPAGAIHVHSVSVGETLLALKVIRAWQQREPELAFVLGVGTATGIAVARDAGLGGVRVVYQPVDFRLLVNRYLDRFEPAKIVLVEGEMWPNLMLGCAERGIPVALINARMSPRSKRRYQRFAEWIKPVFSLLDTVAVQEEGALGIWSDLGVDKRRVQVVGSMKFDQGGGGQPVRREKFAEILTGCNATDPVVLAASTHDGEETLIGRAARDAGAFYLCVPRHAERRSEVRTALEHEGFNVLLRSEAEGVAMGSNCLVVDSTGELRDWTAHAGVAVIGKSFLGVGGQSPAEAILAGVPVVFGPHMENFEPLASRLVEAGGASRVENEEELTAELVELVRDPAKGLAMAEVARRILDPHQGAMARTLDLLSS